MASASGRTEAWQLEDPDPVRVSATDHGSDPSVDAAASVDGDGAVPSSTSARASMVASRRSSFYSNATGPRIRVAARIRPVVDDAKSDGPEQDQSQDPSTGPDAVVAVQTQNAVEYAADAHCGKPKTFVFDHAWSPSQSQADVYESGLRPLLAPFLNGFNVTAIVYGQTGAGKTYTVGGRTAVFGHEAEAAASTSRGVDVGTVASTTASITTTPTASTTTSTTASTTASTSTSASTTRRYRGMAQDGLLVRFLADAFASFHGEPCVRTAKVSFLEIRRDVVLDLLAEANHQDNATPDKPLTVRDDLSHRVWVENLKQVQVETLAKAIELLNCGRGRLEMRPASARSHAIYAFEVTRKFKDDVKTSKALFVDLAGSERPKVASLNPERKENVQINVGLLALGNVIHALQERGSGKQERPEDASEQDDPIPFRASMLTRLLRDSLGGNSRTLLIACLSPLRAHAEETLNTLHFANRLRNLHNRTDRSCDVDSLTSLQSPRNAEVAQLKDEVAKLQQRVKELEATVRAKEEQLNARQVPVVVDCTAHSPLLSPAKSEPEQECSLPSEDSGKIPNNTNPQLPLIVRRTGDSGNAVSPLTISFENVDVQSDGSDEATETETDALTRSPMLPICMLDEETETNNATSTDIRLNTMNNAEDTQYVDTAEQREPPQEQASCIGFIRIDDNNCEVSGINGRSSHVATAEATSIETWQSPKPHHAFAVSTGFAVATSIHAVENNIASVKVVVDSIMEKIEREVTKSEEIQEAKRELPSGFHAVLAQIDGVQSGLMELIGKLEDAATEATVGVARDNDGNLRSSTSKLEQMQSNNESVADGTETNDLKHRSSSNISIQGHSTKVSSFEKDGNDDIAACMDTKGSEISYAEAVVEGEKLSRGCISSKLWPKMSACDESNPPTNSDLIVFAPRGIDEIPVVPMPSASNLIDLLARSPISQQASNAKADEEQSRVQQRPLRQPDYVKAASPHQSKALSRMRSKPPALRPMQLFNLPSALTASPSSKLREDAEKLTRQLAEWTSSDSDTLANQSTSSIAFDEDPALAMEQFVHHVHSFVRHHDHKQRHLRHLRQQVEQLERALAIEPQYSMDRSKLDEYSDNMQTKLLQEHISHYEAMAARQLLLRMESREEAVKQVGGESHLEPDVFLEPEQYKACEVWRSSKLYDREYFQEHVLPFLVNGWISVKPSALDAEDSWLHL